MVEIHVFATFMDDTASSIILVPHCMSTSESKCARGGLPFNPLVRKCMNGQTDVLKG